MINDLGENNDFSENKIVDVAMILKTSARKNSHMPGCEKYKYKYKEIASIVDSEHFEKMLKSM